MAWPINWPSTWTSAESRSPLRACAAVTGTGVTDRPGPTSRKVASVMVGVNPPLAGKPATSTRSPAPSGAVWAVWAHSPWVASWMQRVRPGHCNVTRPRTCTRWRNVMAGS